MECFLLASASLIAYGLGRWCLRRLVPAPLVTPWELAVFSLGLGLGVLSSLMLVLGVLGAWHRGAILTVLAVAAVVAAGELRGVKWHAHAERWTRRLRRASPTTLAFAGLIAATAAMNFIGTLAPVSFEDALACHFAVPKLWLQQGRLQEVPWVWESYQPFGVQMLYLLGMAVWNDRFAALFHWLFGVLTAAGVVSLAKRHAPGANPWLAAAIVYVSGFMAWESTSGFVDLGLVFYTLLTAHAALNALQNKAGTPWLRVAGVCAGLAASIKYAGLEVAALWLMIVLAGLATAGRRKEIPSALAAWTAGLLVAAPWYVKNAAQTGDPLYPVLLGFRSHALGAIATKFAHLHGYGMSLLDLALVPLRLTLQGDAFGRSQLLGPLYVAFLPASALMLCRRTALRWLGLFIALYGLCWFFTAQQVRYLLPAVPLAAVVCASAIAAAGGWGRAARVVSAVAVAASLAAGAAVAALYNAQFVPVVFGRQSQDAFLAQKTWFYDDLRWMNDHLPPEARVLLLTRMGYYLDRAYIGPGEAPWTTRRVQDVVAHQGITHVFCVGDTCGMFPADGKAFMILRQRLADRVSSRTLGESHGAVYTAVLERMVLQRP